MVLVLINKAENVHLPSDVHWSGSPPNLKVKAWMYSFLYETMRNRNRKWYWDQLEGSKEKMKPTESFNGF